MTNIFDGDEVSCVEGMFWDSSLTHREARHFPKVCARSLCKTLDHILRIYGYIWFLYRMGLAIAYRELGALYSGDRLHNHQFDRHPIAMDRCCWQMIIHENYYMYFTKFVQKLPNTRRNIPTYI